VRRAPLNFFDIIVSSTNILKALPTSSFQPTLTTALPITTDSIRYRVNISRLDVVDAWGDISIPGGTYSVLREKRTQYTETRIDAKIPPLGWLDVTDISMQAGISGLGVDTIVSYYFHSEVSKEPIAVVTLNNQQSAIVKVEFKANGPVCPFVPTVIDTWTGCVSNDWATPANWADGTVPTALDDVLIPNVTNSPVIMGGTTALAKSVVIRAGAMLTINAMGNLEINGSDSNGLNNMGTFNNSGVLDIGKVSAVAANGVQNSGNFQNLIGGSISIDRSASFGAIFNFGNFTNAGTIALGSEALSSQDGIHNAFNGSFINLATGEISIARSFGNGIWHYATNGFQNFGKITIGSVASGGISGILNDATFTNSGAFAEIAIVQSGSGINNRALGNFSNTTCARIITLRNISNTGQFSNAGLIVSETAQMHNNSGVITNDGIIAYPLGNPIPNVMNNEININPVTVNDCGPIPAAFDLGSKVDLTIVGVFTDQATLMSAGTYVTATNTFNPSPLLANGTNSFFVKIEDSNGGCTRTVPWTITVNDNILPTIICPDTQTIVLEADCTATLPDYTGMAVVSDNCGVQGVTQSPAIGTQVSGAGPMVVTLTVTDVNGLTNACTFTVTKVDNTQPSITCTNQTLTFNGENTIQLVADNLIESTDNCGIGSTALFPAFISCTEVGQTIPVTIQVSDSNGNSSSCVSQVTVIGLPCGWNQTADGVNCIDGNQVAFNPMNQEWTLTSSRCYYAPNATTDAMAFAQRTLCGNGSITALVTGISGDALGWAGVIMRENNSGGARKAQLTTNLGTFSRREFRTITGGTAMPQQFLSPNRYWLRIQRSGNQFSMHVSQNGVTWFFAGAQNIVMPTCIEAGLVLTNYTSNSSLQATFSQVSTTGGTLFLNSGEETITDQTLQQASKVTLYPNPTHSEVWIALEDYKGEEVSILVRDINGRVIQHQGYQQLGSSRQHLDLTGMSPGVYLIEVDRVGHQRTVERLVVIGTR
jgi:hypothetical protein